MRKYDNYLDCATRSLWKYKMEQDDIKVSASKEFVRKIRKALGTRLALNHFNITITMKNTGTEFNITTTKGRIYLVYTDKGFNENGEVIWNTRVGWFPSLWDVAEYIATQA